MSHVVIWINFVIFHHYIQWLQNMFYYNSFPYLKILNSLDLLLELFFLVLFIYLERWERREKEKDRTSVCERNTDWLPLTRLRMGNPPVTLWFAVPRSTHWATPVRARILMYGSDRYYSVVRFKILKIKSSFTIFFQF